MSKSAKRTSNRVLFISHGGGPLPLLGDPGHRELVDTLQQLAAMLEKPSAIVVISAHWEAERPTLTSGASPELIYDYYGFPEESYDIEYPAPGQPELAHELSGLMHEKGIDAQLDAKRGFDHGLFVPLKIMYPDADLPCIQLSLVNSLDADEHIRIGEALADLPDDHVLILGSGFSFHNMRAFFAAASDESRALNASFEQWLIETCTSPDLDEAERRRRLVDWESAPGARYCHPREEHLLPLHVCYGVAGRPAEKTIEFEAIGKKASAYLW
jgi:4,5-DOPA dioxygenase extradiol